MAFSFEKLRAYERALQMATLGEKIRRNSKGKISRHLLDQLSRASLSISLNLAEGNGRWHIPDKKQFFWVARGSTFECVPLIEIMRRTGTISTALFQECYDCLEEISKTVSGLIDSFEAKAERPPVKHSKWTSLPNH